MSRWPATTSTMRAERSGSRRRHGHRPRRGHAKRGHHADKTRPARHRQGYPPKSRDRGNIRQSPSFTFLYNALGIPLAAGVLYPFFGLLLSPMFTGAAMSMSTVSVIGNALRLPKMKL
jgi:hypothetical protein